MTGMGKVCAVVAAACWTLVLAPTALAEQYDVNVTYDTPFDANCVEGASPDQNTDCTLREAIVAANNTPVDDVVFMKRLPFGESYALTDPLPTNTGGAGKLTVLGNSDPTNNQFSAIQPSPGERVFLLGGPTELNNININNGAASPGGQAGGAIQAGSHGLTLTAVTILNATASTDGGAVDANGQVAISRSTFVGNTATTGFGGAIHLGSNAIATVESAAFIANVAGLGGGGIQNGGSLSVTNSGFLMNTAKDFGGAIDNFDGVGTATTNVNSSTFRSNVADSDNSTVGSGGATMNGDLDPGSSFTITNSLLQGNTLRNAAGPSQQCSGPHVSLGYNIRSGDDGATCTGFGAVGDQLAVANFEAFGSLTLVAGPGINQGGNCPPTDITGRSRAPFAPCDVGAFESTILPPPAAGGPPAPPAPPVKCPKGKKLKKGKCVKKKKKKRKRK